MNRRLRRLLTGGLLGAAVRLVMGRRKQRIMGQRRNGQQLRSMFHSFLNTIRKEGWFLPKRRIR
jgi:hypothetical protein